MLKRIRTLLQNDDGFAFPLYTAWMTITFGVIILGILLWFATGVRAREDLRNAAESACYAGQAQVQQAYTATNSGYVSASWTMNNSQVVSAAQSIWAQEVANDHFESLFNNLQMSVTVSPSNVVSVTVTGTYVPVFLVGIIKKFPQVVPNVSVPMTLTVTNDYPVLGP